MKYFSRPAIIGVFLGILFPLLLSSKAHAEGLYGALTVTGFPESTEEITGEDGTVSVTAEGEQLVSSNPGTGALTIYSGDLTVSSDGNHDGAIVIAGDASVTLAGVTVTGKGNAALQVFPGITAKVILAGGSDNILTGAGSYAALEPGWESQNFSDLTISGEGSLTASGGSGSAGIGGSKSRNGVYGNITIEGERSLPTADPERQASAVPITLPTEFPQPALINI